MTQPFIGDEIEADDALSFTLVNGNRVISVNNRWLSHVILPNVGKIPFCWLPSVTFLHPYVSKTAAAALNLNICYWKIFFFTPKLFSILTGSSPLFFKQGHQAVAVISYKSCFYLQLAKIRIMVLLLLQQ